MITKILIVTLITIGLAYTQAKEDGPFGLSKLLRTLAERTGIEWIKDGFSCPFCVSFWVALAAALLYYPFGYQEFFKLWLGGFGLSVAFFVYVGYGSR